MQDTPVSLGQSDSDKLVDPTPPKSYFQSSANILKRMHI